MEQLAARQTSPPRHSAGHTASDQTFQQHVVRHEIISLSCCYRTSGDYRASSQTAASTLLSMTVAVLTSSFISVTAAHSGTNIGSPSYIVVPYYHLQLSVHFLCRQSFSLARNTLDLLSENNAPELTVSIRIHASYCSTHEKRKFEEQATCCGGQQASQDGVQEGRCCCHQSYHQHRHTHYCRTGYEGTRETLGIFSFFIQFGLRRVRTERISSLSCS